MKRNKFMAAVLAVSMITMLILTGCGSQSSTQSSQSGQSSQAAQSSGSKDSYNVTWVTPSTESEFWQYQQIGMENAVADLQEKYGITINFSVVGPATEAETEAYIRAFENTIASHPDAIITATLVPDSTTSVARDATNQGIVVNFTNCGLEGMDSDDYSDCYNEFYTTQAGDIGDLAGQVFLQLMEEAGMEKSGIVSMEYSQVIAAQQPRMDNFKAYIEANSDIQVLDTLYNNNDLARAQADIENEIATYGSQLVGMFGANNISGDGIALAIENAGIKDKVISIGVDSDTTEIAALEAGTLDCIIIQDAYGQGYASLENAIETLVQGKNPESAQKIAMPPVAVLSSNMHEPEYAAMLDPTLLKK